MVNLNTLEAQKKKAEEEKEANIVKAQIKVYEGQTYEARDAYAEAKAKRGKSRAKLPEKIPEDSAYKEQMLQSQMIQVRVVDPKQRQQVDEYQAEIKKQQKAKETTRILDEQMPALLSQAEQEVESVKESVYVTAKETATKEQNALIQSYSTQIKTESERRSAEIQAVNEKWDSNKSPWYKDGKQFGGYMERDNDSRKRNWIKNQNQGKKDELAAVTMSHVKADGFSPTSINRGGFIPYPTHPTSRKLYTGEAINQHAVKALQSGTTPSNRWTRYQVEITRANQAVYAGGSLSAHASAVQAAKNTFDGLELKEQKSNSAKARAESVNQLAQDQKHWNEVISNPNTSGASQTAITALGLSHNVNDLNASGVSSIYNVGDMTKAGFLPTSATVTLNTSSPYKKVGDTVDMIPTRTNTSSDSRTNEENIIQKQYVKDLRTGKVGLADSLLTQRTAGGYTGANTVNLKTFLAERGYNLSRPETIPDSVFKPVKYDEARKQATYAYKTDTEMGDLRNLVPPIQEVSSSVLQTRQKANAERAGILGTVSKQADMSFAKDKMVSGGAITIQRNASSTNLVSGGKFDPFNADPIKAQENKGYTWTVSVPNTEKFPTMSGGVFEANAPPTEHTFNSEKEAKLFAKSSQPKVFSGTDNEMFNRWNYPSAVDTGEVIHPSKTKTLYDDVRLGFGYVFRPTYNIGATVYNLAQPENKQVPIFATAEDKLIGGTITDVMEGQPLRGTGVTSFTDYVVENPFRALAEVPSAVVTGVMGGKAITYGIKGVSAGVKVSAKLGTNILASNAPNVVKIPTMAMMGAGQAVQRVGTKISAVPVKIGSAVYDYGTIPRGMKYGTQVFTTPQQVVRQGIVRPYDKATMFQGSRVGFGAKANFIMTPSGRMFVRQSTDIAGEIGVKPQFLNRQVAMFENENVVGFATRGKMKTTKYEMPKETPFKSDVFAPTKKTELVLKKKPKEQKPFPELYDSKATTTGKPFPELYDSKAITNVKSKIETPNVFDRLKHSVLKDSETMPTIKKVKTNIDEVTFYSDTTGDLTKGVIRPKAELQGQGVNYRGFEKPEITGTRTRLQDYKTSTSQPTIKGQLKYSEVAGGKIKFKGSPIRQVDTIVTGAKLTGKKNLKLIDDMVEEGQIEEIGKKTVMKGEDYFGGGKKFNLKQNLESRNPTQYETATGKIKPKDETVLYGVSKGKIPVDKKAFAQTMKESNLLREMADKAPLNKKPVVPKGVDEPVGKYHAFVGESKSIGKGFQGTRIELGSGIGTTGVGSSFTKTNVDLGKGGGISNIKDVKGMSSKSDVFGITTNRINVKKFEEPKIQKGDKIVDGKEGSTVQKTKVNIFQETKIKLGQSAVIKPAQIQVPRVKAGVKSPKVSPKIKQIVTPIISQKTGTGTIQETSQLTKQQTKQVSKTKQVPKIKQVQRLRSVQSQVAVTAVVAKTAQVQMTSVMKIPVTQKTTTRKGGGALFYDTPNPTAQKRKSKRGKKAGFIGNVRLDNVMGMYKRKEITYGKKKVTRLERQDMRLTAGTSNRIAMPASGLLKTKKKGKRKTETVFGRTVTKTRDEFSGFESKSKKKSKGKKKSKTKRLM